MQNLINYGKKYSRDIIIFILLLICIGLLIFKIYDDKNEVQAKSISLLENIPNEVKEESTELINVDIKGAIKKPGVYSVKNNAIINDVVKLAGGFKSNAYKNGINLSKKVADEMVIYVYTKNEIAEQKKENSNTNSTTTNSNSDTNSNKSPVNNDICSPKTYDITDCIDSKNSIIDSKSDAKNENTNQDVKDNTPSKEDRDKTNKLVNINTASLEELMTITGIGESKAKAIISYREENGNFQDITCITNVSGIGEALFAKIKDSITI